MAAASAIQAFSSTGMEKDLVAAQIVSPGACMPPSPATKPTAVPKRAAALLRVDRRSACQVDEANTAPGVMEAGERGSESAVAGSTPFTIRGFVASVRDADLKETWPFTEGSLKWRTMQRGDQPGILPSLDFTALTRLLVTERDLRLGFQETRLEGEGKEGTTEAQLGPHEGHEPKRSFSNMAGLEEEAKAEASMQEATKEGAVQRADSNPDTYKVELSTVCDIPTSMENDTKRLLKGNSPPLELCKDHHEDVWQAEPKTFEGWEARSKSLDVHPQKSGEKTVCQGIEAGGGELLDKFQVRGHCEPRADLSSLHQEDGGVQGQDQSQGHKSQGDDTLANRSEEEESADGRCFEAGAQELEENSQLTEAENVVEGELVTESCPQKAEIPEKSGELLADSTIPTEGEEGECLVCRASISPSNSSLNTQVDQCLVKTQTDTTEKSGGQGSSRNQILKVKVQKKRSLADLCASAPRLDLKYCGKTNLLRRPDDEELDVGGPGRRDSEVCRQPRTPFYRGPLVRPKKVRSNPFTGVQRSCSSAATNPDEHREKKSRLFLVSKRCQESKRPVADQQDVEMRKKRRQLVTKPVCDISISGSIGSADLSVVPPAVTLHEQSSSGTGTSKGSLWPEAGFLNLQVPSNHNGSMQIGERNWMDAQESSRLSENYDMEHNCLDEVPIDEEFVAGNELMRSAVVHLARGLGNGSEFSSRPKAEEELPSQETNATTVKKWVTSGDHIVTVRPGVAAGFAATTKRLPPSAPRNTRVDLTTGSKLKPRISASDSGTGANENTGIDRSSCAQLSGSGESSAGTGQLEAEIWVGDQEGLSMSVSKELCGNGSSGLSPLQMKAVVVKHKQRIFLDSPATDGHSLEGKNSHHSVRGATQPRKKSVRRENEFLKAMNPTGMSVTTNKKLKRKGPPSLNMHDDIPTLIPRSYAILQEVLGLKKYFSRGRSFPFDSGCTTSYPLESRANAPALQAVGAEGCASEQPAHGTATLEKELAAKATDCAAKLGSEDQVIAEVQVSELPSSVKAASIDQLQLASEPASVYCDFPGGRGEDRSDHASSGLKHTERGGGASGQSSMVRLFGSHVLRLMGRNVMIWQEEKPEAAAAFKGETGASESKTLNGLLSGKLVEMSADLSRTVAIERSGMVGGSGVSAGWGPAVEELETSANRHMRSFLSPTSLPHEMGHEEPLVLWQAGDANEHANRTATANKDGGVRDGRLLVANLSRKRRNGDIEQRPGMKLACMESANGFGSRTLPLLSSEFNNRLPVSKARHSVPVIRPAALGEVATVTADSSLRRARKHENHSVETLLKIGTPSPVPPEQSARANNPGAAWCPVTGLDRSCNPQRPGVHQDALLVRAAEGPMAASERPGQRASRQLPILASASCTLPNPVGERSAVTASPPGQFSGPEATVGAAAGKMVELPPWLLAAKKQREARMGPNLIVLDDDEQQEEPSSAPKVFRRGTESRGGEQPEPNTLASSPAGGAAGLPSLAPPQVPLALERSKGVIRAPMTTITPLPAMVSADTGTPAATHRAPPNFCINCGVCWSCC